MVSTRSLTLTCCSVRETFCGVSVWSMYVNLLDRGIYFRDFFQTLLDIGLCQSHSPTKKRAAIELCWLS